MQTIFASETPPDTYWGSDDEEEKSSLEPDFEATEDNIYQYDETKQINSMADRYYNWLTQQY